MENGETKYKYIKQYKTMMTYIFMIVLPPGPKVFTHVIPAMERIQGLLGTLEAVFD
jgi:hypothetical protein